MDTIMLADNESLHVECLSDFYPEDRGSMFYCNIYVFFLGGRGVYVTLLSVAQVIGEQ